MAQRSARRHVLHYAYGGNSVALGVFLAQIYREDGHTDDNGQNHEAGTRLHAIVTISSTSSCLSLQWNQLGHLHYKQL